jgi:hypothetical protein
LVFSSTFALNGLDGFFSLIPSGDRSGSSTPSKQRIHRMTTSGFSIETNPNA